jgi:hypothetical protein
VSLLPTRRVHLKFDEYLRAHGIICKETLTNTVHERMDRDLQVHGHWDHRYIDYYHNIDGIRDWIRKWSHLGNQETLTDYVRVALGHLVLDEIHYRNEWKNEDDLIKRAYRSFVMRGFHKCYFKKI